MEHLVYEKNNRTYKVSQDDLTERVRHLSIHEESEDK